MAVGRFIVGMHPAAVADVAAAEHAGVGVEDLAIDSWHRHADVLLEPEVHQIDWNDFSRVDEAFSAGADAMRKALPSVRELLARRSNLQPSAGLSHPGERGLAL